MESIRQLTLNLELTFCWENDKIPPDQNNKLFRLRGEELIKRFWRIDQNQGTKRRTR